MRKLYFIILFLTVAYAAKSQNSALNASSNAYNWTADVSVYTGIPISAPPTLKPPIANAVIPNTTTPLQIKGTINNSQSFGFDGELNYHVKKSNFSLSAGIILTNQSNKIDLDSFKAQFRNIDNLGKAFQQVVTMRNHHISENITSYNLNIPLLIKYKHRVSRRMDINLDGGLLVSLVARKGFKTTDNVFDYEAVYWLNSTNGSIVEPGTKAANITKWYVNSDSVRYSNVNAKDNIIAQQKNRLNVGLGVPANQGDETGTIGYNGLGVLVRAQGCYHFTPSLAFLLGVSISYQAFFQTNGTNNYQITNKITNKSGEYTGEYNSLLNSMGNYTTSIIGINLGLRYILRM